MRRGHGGTEARRHGGNHVRGLYLRGSVCPWPVGGCRRHYRPAAYRVRAAATICAYLACISSHSVSSSDRRASFSSVDVMMPFSYETSAIERPSRASSTALFWVETISREASRSVEAEDSSRRAPS